MGVMQVRTGKIKLSKNQTKSDLDRARTCLIQDLRNHQAELVAQNEELRAVQQQLELSRDKYSRLYELAPIGYFTHDGNGVILESNQMFAELLDVSSPDLTQMTFHSFVAHEFQDFFYLHCKAVLKSQRRHVCELKVQRQNKIGFFARLESIALKTVNSASTLILTSFCDVSNIKEAEEKLRAAGVLAEAANSAKSEFLANMSHEIRTPLSAILGYDLMLFKDDLDVDSRLECAQKIKVNGEHLLHLLEDILDLSKVESGNIALETRPFSLKDELAPFVKEFQIRAHARGLNFKIETEGQLPEVILTDPLRFKQILFNIVGNAIKFTEKGEVSLSFKVTNSSSPNGIDSLLEIVVSDTGIGMSEDEYKGIFKLFSQADASIARKYGGSGLGLVLSRSLACALGGNIVLLESTPGKGSQFKITVGTGPIDDVPMLQKLPFNEPEKLVVTPAKNRRGLLKGVRVLVAEDSPDVQFLIKHFLQIADATVNVVSNGRDAVTLVQSQPTPFDVIFMDVQMPTLDGYKATKILRQSGYVGPIVALTAHAMKGQREICLQAGCNDYLTKPVDFERLIDTALNYSKLTAHANRVG